MRASQIGSLELKCEQKNVNDNNGKTTHRSPFLVGQRHKKSYSSFSLTFKIGFNDGVNVWNWSTRGISVVGFAFGVPASLHMVFVWFAFAFLHHAGMIGIGKAKIPYIFQMQLRKCREKREAHMETTQTAERTTQSAKRSTKGAKRSTRRRTQRAGAHREQLCPKSVNVQVCVVLLSNYETAAKTWGIPEISPYCMARAELASICTLYIYIHRTREIVKMFFNTKWTSPKFGMHAKDQ